MGYEERRAVGEYVLYGVLYQLLGLGVDGTGGLVEHEDARVGQHGPGEGDELLFAGGELVAAIAHVAVPAVFQPLHHPVGGDGAGGGLYLLVRGVQPAVADVLPHGAGEEVGALEHIAYGRVEPELAALAVVAPVYQYLAGGGLKEAAGQVDQRALAGPRLAHDGHGGAGGYLEIEVAEHVLAAVGVAERDVAELYVAAYGLPVLAPGVEGVAVFLDHFRAVLHQGLGVQQPGDALDAGLDADELGYVLRHQLHGLEDAHGVGCKGGERAQLYEPGEGQRAAAHQYHGHGHGGEKEHQRDIDGAQARGLHAALVHLPGEAAETLAVVVLDYQGFGGLGAHDALVERAHYPAVQLAHAAVPGEDFPLEIGRYQGNQRHDDHHHQRQAPVEQQHGYEHAGEVDQRPYDVRQRPADEPGDFHGVAHDAAEDVAHGRDVVVGEAQRLQVGEGLAAHVAAHGHLDEHGVAPHDPDGAGLRQYGPQIAERVGQQALQGVLFNELVHGVALEERQGHVHQRRHAVEEQHEQEGPLVAGEEGQHALPGGEAELLGVIQLVISHFPAPPPR